MNSHLMTQLITAFTGSIGFAIFFKIKGRQIFFAGLGGFLTWGVYLIAFDYLQNNFTSNLIGAVFAAFFAEIMARIQKAPATIFLSAAAINLFPGGRLYYSMYGLVNDDKLMFKENGETAIIISLAIAIGFVSVTIFNKYLFSIKRPAIRKVEVNWEKLKKEVIELTKQADYDRLKEEAGLGSGKYKSNCESAGESSEGSDGKNP